MRSWDKAVTLGAYYDIGYSTFAIHNLFYIFKKFSVESQERQSILVLSIRGLKNSCYAKNLSYVQFDILQIQAIDSLNIESKKSCLLLCKLCKIIYLITYSPFAIYTSFSI